MPLIDLLRSLPGLALVAVLPGFLLATACAPRWRWWLRAAVAPGLSGGVVGLVGMLYRDIHIRFDAATAVPVLVALAVVAWRRSRGVGADAAVSPRCTALIVAVSLGTGAVTVAMMAASLRDLPLPFETDTPVHGQVAAAIVRTGDALPVLREPVTGGTWVRLRTGFEAVAALTSEVGGPPAARAMLPVTAVSLLLLPLGIAAIAWEATRSLRITALTPLLGATLPFPTFPVIFGELPLVTDSTLVTGLILAAVWAVRGGRVRDCAAMTVALVASIWVIHGTEVLTALVVAGPLLVVLLWARRGRDLRAALQRLGVIAAACVAGAALTTLLTRQPALIGPGSNPLGGHEFSSSAQFAATIGKRRWIDLIDEYRFFVFPAQWMLWLWAAGILAAVLCRRLRWALVAQAVMLACLVDVVVTGHLGRLWQEVFPWSTDDRLMSIQYWVLPMIMALGLVSAVDAVVRLAMAAPAGRPRPTLRVAVPITAMAAVTAVAVLPGFGHMGDLYTSEKALHVAATPSDVSVIERLGAVLPHGSVVLTEGVDDAGQWIGALTQDVPFFSTDYARGHFDDARIVLLSQACIDPQRAATVLDGVDAVFVGADRVARARHPWSADCLRRVPALRPIGQDGASAAFVVVRP